MTRVCMVGSPDVTLRYELLSRETSRAALQTYDLRAPYRNTIGLETVSLGAAVSLLNDLNWYLIRFVDDALVLEPSIDEEEWLSRDLATAVRQDEVQPDETGRLLKVYGIERPDDDGDRPPNRPSAEDQPGAAQQSGEAPVDGEAAGSEAEPRGEPGEATEALPRLVEPMFVSRTDDSIPEYDIRDVDDTLVVRVTEREFEGR